MARPRSLAAHQAALDATVEVLLEHGVDGVTLEAVAARSGVAKSTLYRHFGTKESLVAQAAQGCMVEHPTPDTGSLEQDLRQLFGKWLNAEERSRIPNLLPMLVDASSRDEAMRTVLQELLEERRRPIRTVLRLAQARGEIGADVDLEDALSLLIGPFTHRRMIDRRDIDPAFAEFVLHAALAALRATTTATARPA